MFGKKNLPMFPVFSSGTARLLSTISGGNHCVIPLHSVMKPYYGPNFVGHFFNIKQHIQFIKLIKGEIELSDEQKAQFLSGFAGKSANEAAQFEPADMIEGKLATLKESIATCKHFVFELCSLEVYEKDGVQLHHELIDKETAAATKRKQTAGELISDIETLIGLLPEGATVLFIGPIRPQLYDTTKEEILDVELIYATLNYSTGYILLDPTIIVKKGGSNMLLPDGEFTVMGRALFFIYLYEKHFKRYANKL